MRFQDNRTCSKHVTTSRIRKWNIDNNRIHKEDPINEIPRYIKSNIYVDSINNSGYLYVVYLGANNLYGYVMRQYLPTGNFKWIEEEWIKQKIDLKDDSKVGYLFDVNISYSEKLHDYFNQYPPLPTNINVEIDY